MGDEIEFSRLQKELVLFRANFIEFNQQKGLVTVMLHYVVPYFERLCDLIEPLEYSPFQVEKLNTIITSVLDYLIRCNSIYTSYIDKTDSILHSQVEDSLSSLLELYNENRIFLDGIVSLAIGNNLSVSHLHLENEVQKLKEAVSIYETKTKQSIESLELLAQETIIPKYAEVYESAKREYDESAGGWLFAGVLFGSFLILSVIWVLNYIPIPTYQSNDNPFVYIITNFSLRFTLIGIFLYLLYFVGHKYNVAKHNATLYGSKSAALKSFLAFIQTTSDNEVKNAMLIAITDFIFKGNNTGYLESDRVVGDLNPNNAMKVLSDLIHKAK